MIDSAPSLAPHAPDEDAGHDLERTLLATALAERDALRAELAAMRAIAGAPAGADRLRDAFFAMASHELRTPLQSLELNVSLMSTRVHATADEVPTAWLSARLERTQRLVERMRRLVDGLLDVSELASGSLALRREPVDLGELARGVVSGAADVLDWAGCPCELDVEDDVVGAWDRFRVELVLENLLGNATRYAAGKPIAVDVAREGGAARLRVRDHGPGVRPEHRARIFERFERGDAEASVAGFGLGLWIVRALAEAHGGGVAVEDTPGGGATFVVTLPVRAPTRSPASAR